MAKDEIYRTAQTHVVDFAFDEAVTKVFPDMIRRSVPGYDNIVSIAGMIAARHIKAGSNCYDLGCSRGAITLSVLRSLDPETNCTLHAIDSSQSMIAEASKHLTDSRVRLHNADIREVELINASAVIMNFTLQFLPPIERAPLLERIHSAMVPGGVLVLSEKLTGTTEFDDLHQQFKRENGYSALEISQKRTALEEVMRIDDLSTHLARLQSAGFKNPRVWFRCLNWVSILANARASDADV